MKNDASPFQEDESYSQNGVRRLGEPRPECKLVGQRPGGAEETSFLAGELCDASFEGSSCRILVVNVVSPARFETGCKFRKGCKQVSIAFSNSCRRKKV